MPYNFNTGPGEHDDGLGDDYRDIGETEAGDWADSH